MSSDRRPVPLAADVSRRVKIGRPRVSLVINDKHWVKGPDPAPYRGIQGTRTFLFLK